MELTKAVPKWFTFSQNNSGGYFIKNDDVSEYVCIQANSVAEVKQKAEDLFQNYSEYCECCGERWSWFWIEESDGDDIAMIYSEPVTTTRGGAFRSEAILHLIDGRVARVKFLDGTAHHDQLNHIEWIKSGDSDQSAINAIGFDLEKLN